MVDDMSGELFGLKMRTKEFGMCYWQKVIALWIRDPDTAY